MLPAFGQVREYFNLPPESTVTAQIIAFFFMGQIAQIIFGTLSDSYGRKRLALSGIAISLAGLALTLPDQIVCITAGLLVFTFGFFATHSVASSWVSARTPGSRGQASAMYLLAYYLGSSAFGALVGLAYQAVGWTGVAGSVAALYALGAVAVLGVRPPASG